MTSRRPRAGHSRAAQIPQRPGWQRGDPQPTTSNGIALQPGTCDGRSVNCLVTGLTAGTAADANDVDGGQTSIQSPPIALPAGSTINLRFRFFFAYLNNATRRTTSGFVWWVTMARYRRYPRSARPPTMSPVYGERGTADLSAWAGETIQLRIDAIECVRQSDRGGLRQPGGDPPVETTDCNSPDLVYTFVPGVRRRCGQPAPDTPWTKGL